MAEKTELEKAQETFERKLKEQEKLLDHQRMVEIERLESRFVEVRSMFEEQKKELLSQNDGLLGAVGRLHGENETLKKRIAELEPALAKAKEDLARSYKEFEFAMQAARQEAEVKMEQLKEKLDEAEKKAKRGKKA